MSTISRRQAIQTLGISAGALGFSRCAGLSTYSGRKRPNILFIFSDDQNFRALGPAGNCEVQTPNLNRLAREGTYFSHCFVSNPICTPSRATVLTGLYGFQSGVTFFGEPIREDVPVIAELLSANGYTTAFTGKWHNNKRPIHHGFQRMRNTFLGGMHNYESIPVVQGADDEKREFPGNPTNTFADGALELMDGMGTDPYALFLWFTTPHDPRTAPPEYEAMYSPAQVSLPPNFMPEPPFDTGTLDIRDEKLLPRPLDPKAVQQETARYYAMITHMDTQIGRLLQRLEERGELDNTFIVFAGDNGLTLGAHGLLGKQTLYEEGVRVPLIVCGPGVRRGKQCDAMVDLMDIMPTLCEVSGSVPPAHVQGRSLMPWLHGKRGERRDAIFCHYHHMFRMVRTERYKLILHLKTGREELFDLQNDPYELNDVSELAAFQDIKKDLRNRLNTWRSEVGDPD